MRRLAALLLLLVPSWSLALAAASAACEAVDAGAGPTSIWLLCKDRRVLLSPDEGKTWQIRNITTDVQLRSVAFLDARRGFVVGSAGTLLGTEDGGVTWRKIPLPVTNNLTAIEFKGEAGWIVGYGGVVLHTDDGGRTWAPQKSGGTQPLECLFFLDAQNGWAGGWIGNIMYTTDGGHTWKAGETPKMAWTVNAIQFLDPKNGWAVGFAGQILRTKDGGATWVPHPSPTNFSLTSILFDGSGTGWITADNDLLVSKDGGETWQFVELAGQPFFNRLIRAGGSLWAVGQYSMFELAAGKQEWQNVGLPQPGNSATASR
jgi:photosystem II stability/assembly factor-like uncharacterized protein